MREGGEEGRLCTPAGCSLPVPGGQDCSSVPSPPPRDHKLWGILKFQLRNHFQDFSGGLVVKTSPSNTGDVGLTLGGGAMIPRALW